MWSLKIRAMLPALLLPLLAFSAAAGAPSGRIAGLVVDANGTPQMGATISILPELVGGSRTAAVFTDARGRFSSTPLATGLYSIRVTLAGFLPAYQQHVDVGDLKTTPVRLHLDSAFTSLERSGTHPASIQQDDDWTWVLRGAAGTRPILRWTDGEVVADGQESASERSSRQPRGQLDISAGTTQPGQVTNFSNAPTTSFAYEMGLGSAGQLVMAGAFNYMNQLPAGGFATLWTQDGPDGDGSVTGMVIRQSELGPDGPGFRGMRLMRQSQFNFSRNVTLHYGGELVLADLDGMTSKLRPNVEMGIQLTPGWHASFTVASQPEEDSLDSENNDGALQSAMNSLNAFPVLLERNNQPILAAGFHEEARLERPLGKSRSISVAAFHDQSGDTAVFGEGSATGANVLPDYFTNGFAYDAGDSGSWGTRVAYRQTIGSDVETTVVYTWAGVLSPYSSETNGDLSSLLATRNRQSLGARVSGKIPRTKTKVIAGYTWISGPVAERLDPYGEAAFGTDPFLNISLRQPLPAFFPCHMVLLADVSNLLAQGYVAVTTRDGQLLLVPSYRTFQGGVSFQF